ncbi:MAG: STAS domain-containing protein [Acidiferrobacterales bacterium]
MASSAAEVKLVSGPLVFDTVPDIYSSSTGWFTGTGDLILDLEAVTQSDSAGLGLLIEWLRLARAAGRTLKFINVPSQMQVLIRVNGLPDALV